jgi:hypothetical protein
MNIIDRHFLLINNIILFLSFSSPSKTGLLFRIRIEVLQCDGIRTT